MGSLGELVSSGWPTMLVGGGVLGVPGTLLAAWWAHKRATRKQTDDVSIAIVNQLKGLVERQTERIQTLELMISTEQRACDARINELHALRAQDVAEAQLREGQLLHRAKNAEADLKALIWVAEFAPDRMGDAIERHHREREEREREREHA